MSSPPRIKPSSLIPPGDAPQSEYVEEELMRLLDPTLSDSAPHRQLSCVELRTKRITALEHLSPLEQEVVMRRFGLDGRPVEDEEKIAEACSISVDEVARIADRTLRKLRWPTPQ